MIVKVNHDECIGCGVCAQICPEVFELDEDAGKAKVIRQGGAECAREASDSCPVGCITVED
ncbi:MAG TPA: ferredoxin [Synergistetes bacterium]|nr:ferredoxin [Synergistota bacterium]